MSVPPHSPEMEDAVIGALLLSERILDNFVTEARLKPEHFYRETNAQLYDAALSIAARGDKVDVLSLYEETKRRGHPIDKARIDGMSGGVPGLASTPGHAKRLVELAYLRSVMRAGHELLAAAETEDHERITQAERLLALPDAASAARSEPWELADMALAQIEKDGADKIPLPFRRLNDLLGGGLTPGDLTYLGGHSSMGKSVLLDQIVAHGAKKTGLTAHVFVNEMNREQRALRLLAGLSGVPFALLNRGKSALVERDYERIFDAAPHIPFGITDCTGWPVEDICREIRWRDYGIVGVDIVHEIPHREVADLDHISRTLTQTARSTGCSLTAAVHLNEKRVMTAVRPPPTLGDIRGSGMFQRQASNVIFVHREQDPETGEPLKTGEGATWLAKARNGGLGGLPVVLNEMRMRFYPGERE